MLKIRSLRWVVPFVLTLALLLSSALPARAVEQGIEETYPAPASAEKIVYGTSGEGRELRAYRFGSGKNVMVLGFAMHGFEDNFDRDGECLVYAAQKVMEQLAGQSERLLRQDWTIYVLPCINPDGLNSGTSKNGPGRCTTTYIDADGRLTAAHGVDINRCFPTDWEQTLTNRNYTGTKPLACLEAAALAEFIEAVKGEEENLLIDVHGWEQTTMTYDGEDELLAETFAEYFGRNTYVCAEKPAGYFTNYAHSLGYDACMFSFPLDVTSLNGFRTRGYAEAFATVVSSLIGSTQTVCEKGTHSFAQISNIPATCENAGSRTVECSFCGKIEKTALAALGHITNAEEHAITKQPTATRSGEACYFCARCDEKYDVQILPAIFSDTDPTRYYADALDRCHALGIISGMEKDKFCPDVELSRGMLVSMLYYSEGSPTVRYAADFSDVPVSRYYFEPVSWAQENGLVAGYEDGTFLPDASVTRQETAAIFYRFVRMKLGEVGGSADLSDFGDADSVLPYARDAVGWCIHNGILYGIDQETIGPRLYATRAQTVSLLYRLLNYLEKQTQ